MCASNALSAGRSYIHRPDHCKTIGNPGRCQPPPPPPPPPPRCTCSLDPNEFTLPPEDGDSLDLAVCCEHLPPGEAVSVVVVLEHGGIDPPDSEPQNCVGTASYPYEAPGYECDDPILFEITFSDDSRCDAAAIAHVVEEEDDDDEED